MLAIVELNESKRVEEGVIQQENSLKQGLQHMQQAHVTDRRHPAVLNTMANHFFLTRDFEKVWTSKFIHSIYIISNFFTCRQ